MILQIISSWAFLSSFFNTDAVILISNSLGSLTMPEQTFLTIMAIILTITSSGLAIIAWKRSRRDFRKPFALLMLAEVVIVWGYLMDVSSVALESKLFWNNMEYIGYLSAVPFFFTFAIQFAWDVKLTRRLAALIFLPAVLFYLSLLTNDQHHAFYVSTSLTPDIYRSFYAIYGPVFYAYVSYAMVLMFGGMFALVHCYSKVSRTHRYTAGVTCMACGLGVLVVFLNYVLVYSIPGSLFVVFGFLTSDVLLFIGAFGFELFSMVPIALERVMQTMKGAVMILDDRDNILFLNPSAEEIVGNGHAHYGKKLTEALPLFPIDLLAKDMDPRCEAIHEVLPCRFFDIHTFPILDHGDHPIGRTITFREVTAQWAAERDARLSREKLELMNRITRHDVMNQLTILEGHLILADMKVGPGAVREHISASSHAARVIQKQMSFAKDYQDMGMRMPQWHDINGIFKNLALSMGLKGDCLTLETSGVEVYADPMLERVFYNLLDNSLTHGGIISKIHVAVQETDGGLDIIYSDDGAGIPSALKPQMFSKGFGRNNGLGLFLCREILSHSGMTIYENGEPGRGVRFVIGVPAGKYRFLAKIANRSVNGATSVLLTDESGKGSSA